MESYCNPVILTYHSISRGSAPLCTEPDLFAAQMDWLKANANIVPLTALVQSLAGGQPVASKTVALTFDDGFDDFYSEAAPVLRRLDMPAIVFVPAAYCGKAAAWDRNAEQKPLMEWTQIRDLVQQGISIGSHGMNHPILTGLTDAALNHEIVESKKIIESETGKAVRFFCYPYGCFDKRTVAAVAACYRYGACTTVLRMLHRTDERFALPRVDMHYLRNFAVFKSLFTPRFRFYLWGRRLTRAARVQFDFERWS